MRVIRPGEGELLCSWPPGCKHREIDGLEFCLWHMPDELLEEAEELARAHRCRHSFPGPDACHQMAVAGTAPPRCKTHGANLGGVISKQAATREVEGRVLDRMAQIMAESGQRLLSPRRLGNPLVELLDLAAEMAEWKDIMRDIVMYLMSEQRIRSAHNRVGEQLRAEVMLFERAQERYARILLDIQKAGIEARLAAIEERQAEIVERALSLALAKAVAGLPDALERSETGRVALRRELTKAAAS